MKKTFKKYEENESPLRVDLSDDVQFLEHFYKMTLRIFGSQCVTANTFFSEIADLFCILTDLK